MPLPTAASKSACPPSCQACRLRQTGAFTAVNEDTLEFIEDFRNSTAEFTAGDTILFENETTGKLFTLYSGWAFRYKSLSDGRRQILNFVLPGDLLGLQQEFSDGSMHGVEAVTDVQLCVFPRDRLWDLFRAHPELGYDITWLSARGKGFVDDNLVTTGQRNATERVAMLLMHLYRRLERLGLVSEGTIEWPINQQHIADTLGLSLVHTNKNSQTLATVGPARDPERAPSPAEHQSA